MVLALTGCKSSDHSSRAHADARHDAGVGKLFVNASVRCSECHEKMRTDWSESAHARAATSPLYLAMRTEAASEAETCDGCHAPLRQALGDSATAAREGVTCDVCHTMKTVSATDRRGSFEMALGDMVRYGPLCDAKDHYFHRMGCAPVFAQPALCGACHFYVRDVAGQKLPVYTEFTDFSTGDGTTCQGCHMPVARAEVANGSPERDGVRGHGFLGKGGNLRQHAVQLTATVAASQGKGGLDVTVQVKNSGSGHPIPNGSPERRIAIRVRALDAAGAVATTSEHELGRMLVDGHGDPAPFYRAVQVGADTRIRPGTAWQDHFELPQLVAGKIEITVLWRSHSAATAARLHVPVTELPMAEAEVPVGPNAKLPRTVSTGGDPK